MHSQTGALGAAIARLRVAAACNWPLLACFALALTVRLLFVQLWFPTCDYDPNIWRAGGVSVERGAELLKNPRRDCFDIASGDAAFYFGQAQMIDEGLGLGSPFRYFINGEFQPSAGHPPMYPVFLAAMRKLGLITVGQLRGASAVAGAVGTYLLALVAKRLAGMRAGVIAGLLAATYPMLWINDGKLMSESIYVPIVAAILLAAFSFWKRPRPKTAILLGLAVAAGQLTRAETGMLAFVMLPPLAYSLRHRMTRSSWMKLGALAFITVQIAVLPWALRNLTSFKRPVLGTSGAGIVLLSGSCDAAYYDEETLGLLNFKCLEGDAVTWSLILQGIAPGGGLDESEVDAAARDKALEYIRAHPGRTPVVVAARIGRMWGLYRITQNIDVDAVIEVRPRTPTVIGVWMYFALWPVALVGLIALRKRRIPISPFLAIFFMTTVVAAISFALTRYRVPSDEALVVLGAVGIEEIIRLARRSRRSRAAAVRHQARADRGGLTNGTRNPGRDEVDAALPAGP
ncbi:MAG: glycosyltransferase family 39 protein [Acidimicrobiales bacterium]|nr:glycosyltransferase family 39 protein [Acidimicrobiales bacterium]